MGLIREQQQLIITFPTTWRKSGQCTMSRLRIRNGNILDVVGDLVSNDLPIINRFDEFNG